MEGKGPQNALHVQGDLNLCMFKGLFHKIAAQMVAESQNDIITEKAKPVFLTSNTQFFSV